MFDIIAIGNALVDTEFKVSDDALTATGLTRGNMTLAEEEGQRALFDTLKDQGVNPAKQAGGGSAANSMVAFASLGGRAFYNCRVGGDDMGDFYLSDLEESGVTTDADIAIDPDGTTGSCAVLVTPDGERTMQTHLGTSSLINGNNINFHTLAGAKWLYLEGYLAMSPTIAQGISTLHAKAKEQGVKVAVSFADPAVVKFAKEGLDAMLSGGVDAIFCNLEEAMLYTGTDSHESAVRALGEFATLVVVTNSDKPALIKQGDEIISVPSAVIDNALDTNGAGDNYAGAFLYAHTQGHTLSECGALAAAVAGRIVTQFGPRLSASDYQAIKADILG